MKKCLRCGRNTQGEERYCKICKAEIEKIKKLCNNK